MGNSFAVLRLLDGLAHLLFLIPFGIIPVVSRNRNRFASHVWMTPNSMVTLAGSHRKAGFLEHVLELPDLLGHSSHSLVTAVRFRQPAALRPARRLGPSAVAPPRRF